MFESDDLFQLIMGFLIGIFICCLLKKRNSYEGFFGYQYNYNNNMFENNKNLSGKSNNLSCNFPSDSNGLRGIRDNNIQWGTNKGWWATILNNRRAHEEISIDFEYTITDPNFVGQFKLSKREPDGTFPPVFNKNINKIKKINDKYVEKITELFNDNLDNLDFKDINDKNPLFTFPLNEKSTADEYIKNFNSGYKRTFEIVNRDKKSLWNLYKDQLDYIKNIYTSLFDDDQEIMAEKILVCDIASGKWKKLSDYMLMQEHLDEDPWDILSVRYYDDEEEINSLINTMFGNNIQNMISKIDKNIEIIEEYNKYNIQDYGYINAYKKLIDYTGNHPPYDEDEEDYKYYYLFNTILEVDTPNDDKFPSNDIISDWVSYVNVYGTINGRSILKLYNIGQDKKNTGCSNNKGRCYFNDTGEGQVGKVAVQNAWGSFYKDSPGNRSNKSYLSPYMMKGNKDRREMYNFEGNSDKDAKEKCESIARGISTESGRLSPWRKSPGGHGESDDTPNYCYLSSIPNSLITDIPDYSKCAEYPWPETSQPDSPP